MATAVTAAMAGGQHPFHFQGLIDVIASYVSSRPAFITALASLHCYSRQLSDFSTVRLVHLFVVFAGDRRYPSGCNSGYDYLAHLTVRLQTRYIINSAQIYTFSSISVLDLQRDSAPQTPILLLILREYVHVQDAK